MSEENTVKLDFGAIDFTPDWARKDAGVSVGKFKASQDSAPASKSGDGDYGRRNSGERGERRFQRERRNDVPRRNFGEGNADRRDRERRQGPRPEHRVERPQPLDVDVQILPDPKALGTIFKKIQGGTHAYKLKELAYFLLDNPSSVMLKITSKDPQNAPLGFFQCKVCGFASNRQEEVIEHIVCAHLTDYYDSKEMEVDPPTGNFTCVAKCGLSGVLLGPPNIHEFGATVREMIRKNYPGMSESQYRSHIEMIRDPEMIEQWRKSAVKRTVFVPKGAPEDAIPLTREQAEGEFRRTILANLLDTPKRLMITAEQALKSPVKGLVWAAKDALEAERRAPYNMSFALRGAFHHRKLRFFRANDTHGPEFVSNMEYREFDVEHAIPELASVAKFVAEHPCCDWSEFPQDEETKKYLNWLVTTGHVVAFTNGVYSAVEKFPKYGPQWKNRKPKAKPKSEDEEKPKPEVVEEAAKEEVKEEVKNEAPAQLAE